MNKEQKIFLCLGVAVTIIPALMMLTAAVTPRNDKPSDFYAYIEQPDHHAKMQGCINAYYAANGSYTFAVEHCNEVIEIG